MDFLCWKSGKVRMIIYDKEVDCKELIKTEMEHRDDAYWIEDSDPGEIIGTHWACSDCKVCYGERKVWNPMERGWRYCPSCGARMNRVKWE